MNYTSRLRLPLFEAADKPSWLTDWNGAMNTLDEAISDLEIGNIPGMQDLLDRLVAVEASVTAGQEIMSAIELNFASRFNSATTYSHGDYCVYDHSLYQYTDPTPSSGDFDGVKWSIRSVSSIVEEIYYQINSAVSSINNEIGTDYTAGSIKGRITNVETEIGTDSTPNSIKGRITTLEGSSGGSISPADIMEFLLHYGYNDIGWNGPNPFATKGVEVVGKVTSGSVSNIQITKENTGGVYAPSIAPVNFSLQLNGNYVSSFGEQDLLNTGKVTESDRYYFFQSNSSYNYCIFTSTDSNFDTYGCPRIVNQKNPMLDMTEITGLHNPIKLLKDTRNGELFSYLGSGTKDIYYYFPSCVFCLDKNFTISKRSYQLSVGFFTLQRSLSNLAFKGTNLPCSFLIIGEEDIKQIMS